MEFFRSTDNGENWAEVDSGLPTNTHVNAFILVPNGVGVTDIFAGAYNGLFLSTNNGNSWTSASTGMTNTEIHSLAASGANLFAGTYKGVFLSTDNGTSWINISTGLPTSEEFTALIAVGTNIFAGSHSGAYLSTDNGSSWGTINTGFTIYHAVRSFFISRANLYAVTSSGIWKRPLSEMITSVQELSNNLPSKFKLEQNYPNPFNPSTKIDFQIPVLSFVEIKVYDLLGREVATLVNEEENPGEYETTFDGSKLASGVYFYRMQAGDFIQTKKLLLMK